MTQTAKEIGPKRAKLFQSGKSQAIRPPREFRFSGTKVTHQPGSASRGPRAGA